MSQAALDPPVNDLEDLLKRAAEGDAQAQTEFTTALIDAELWAVGSVEGGVESAGDGKAVLGEGARLRLFPARLPDGRDYLPIFTSLQRLRAATAGQSPPHLGLPGRVLLQARPADLPVVINAGVWYGKELLPGEIVDLLTGRRPGSPRAEVVPAGQEVYLGHPAVYPQALADALAEHFRHRGLVAEARLGWIHVPSSGAPPHPLVGVRPAGDASLPDALAGTDDVVRGSYDGPVDFVPLDGSDPGRWLVVNAEPFFTSA